VGTIRSFGPAYSRGPFRTIAAELDRAAGPQSPVDIVSLDGYLAVQEQVRRPHRFVPNLGVMWSSTPAGGRAYLILDETVARLSHIARQGRLRHSGFVLLSRRRYGGASATDVLVYRRAG
jgi:hypothetical protein